MERKEFNEIFCGREIDGAPKSTVLMIVSMVDKDDVTKDESKRVIKEYSSLTCAIDVFPNVDTIEAYLHCYSNLDDDLSEFWDMIKLYYDLIKEVEETDTQVPLLELIVIPNKFEGKLFVTAINPIFHALTSENPKEYNHIIALMYNSNNVLCVEPEEFDLTSYLADAEREAEQKIAMLERDEIERMKNGG